MPAAARKVRDGGRPFLHSTVSRVGAAHLRCPPHRGTVLGMAPSGQDRSDTCTPVLISERYCRTLPPRARAGCGRNGRERVHRQTHTGTRRSTFALRRMPSFNNPPTVAIGSICHIIGRQSKLPAAARKVRDGGRPFLHSTVSRVGAAHLRCPPHRGTVLGMAPSGQDRSDTCTPVLISDDTAERYRPAPAQGAGKMGGSESTVKRTSAPVAARKCRGGRLSFIIRNLCEPTGAGSLFSLGLPLRSAASAAR